MRNEGVSSVRLQAESSAYSRIMLCVALFLLRATLFVSTCFAQFNTDRLVTIGRSALYFEDYVLSIQYFNQVIASKPWLYEPWYYRGVAKYYLDDYAGAESDCTEAIQRNPFVVGIYELRGLCRIQQQNYAGAIADYNAALRYEPENQSIWHNRVLCHIHQKEYDTALLQVDTMLTHWSRNAKVHAMQSEVLMLQGDTAKAITALDKALQLDAYDGHLWSQRAVISMAQKEWRASEGYLDKAIHLLPKQVGNYINRAVARFNQNNLRGTMSDYDIALDLDPNNFLAHYNRGLLRAQVGDDNRAITDFDFVLQLEPDNLMALFNRALLLEQTGNINGAIADYTKVIDEFPNFWFGLQHRASCYRRLGMTHQAELDEYRVLKAQIDKRYGKQPRLSKQQMRRRSDLDIEKYNQLAVADEQEIEHDYQSDYRGRVQNHRVTMDYLPMYAIAFERESNKVKNYVAFDAAVDTFNIEHRHVLLQQLHVSSTSSVLDERTTRHYFALIDTLSQCLDSRAATASALPLLLQRAIAFTVTQNDESAIDDLSACIQSDSTQVLAYWQRAVCQTRLNTFHASQGTDIRMKTANALNDFTEAIRLHRSQYLYYNRGNVYIQRNDMPHAIADYTEAIAIDGNLAEAYYNRGLAHLSQNEQAQGIADLSKAGELGLYSAYSIIKQYRK